MLALGALMGGCVGAAVAYRRHRSLRAAVDAAAARWAAAEGDDGVSMLGGARLVSSSRARALSADLIDADATDEEPGVLLGGAGAAGDSRP